VQVMTASERSFADLLRDIVRDLQEIIRSEVRLARTEIGEEIGKAKSAGMALAMAAVTGLFGLAFLLLAAVYALALVLPNWAAALIVGGVMALIAAVSLGTGKKRMKEIHPKPERTVETIKENVAWAKQQAK